MTTDRCKTAGDAWTPPGQLRELAVLDEMLLPELIRTFEEDTALRLERIRSAAVAGDRDRLRSEAHTIKGSASQMGAATVAELCREIEHKCSTLSVTDLAA